MKDELKIQGRIFPSLKPNTITIKAGVITNIDPIENSKLTDTLPIFLPGFVDAHCHMAATGLDTQKLDLSSCNFAQEVLDLLVDKVVNYDKEWLIAIGYDQNRWGGNHLTRFELDKICNTQPIVLRHANFHAGVANSKALELADISLASNDPPGGRYGRDDEGNLNGVLYELALAKVLSAAPVPTQEEITQGFISASDSLRKLGICAVADMGANGIDLITLLKSYQIAQQNPKTIPVRFYVPWRDVFGKRGVGIKELEPFKHLIAGIKLFCDGAIGSSTAAIYGSYSGATPDGARLSAFARDAVHKDGVAVSGQLIYSPERFHQMIAEVDQSGFPIAIHSIGDYATDLVIEGFQATQDPKKHRIEHAMLLSDHQIERIAKLGTSVSMQPEFLSHFGHAYRLQLGEDRTRRLNRYQSVLNAGIPLSLSSDRPIIPGNPKVSIGVSVQRPPDFDPSENLTFEQALFGWTEAAAKMSGFDANYGAIRVGSPAMIQSIAMGNSSEFPVDFSNATWTVIDHLS